MRIFCQIDKLQASHPAPSSDPKGAPPTRIDPLGRRPLSNTSVIVITLITMLSAAVRKSPRHLQYLLCRITITTTTTM